MDLDGDTLVTPVVGPAGPGSDRQHPTVHVVRQPILDGDAQLVGYELLFRGPHSWGAGAGDHRQATSKVIVDGLIEVGLFDLVGSSTAHLNVSRDLLLELRPLPLPAERTVLELIDHDSADESLIEVLRELDEQRFTIALDGFRPNPRSEELLGQVQMVKIDVPEHPGRALGELVAGLREQHPALTLVAEKVETGEEFERCRALGFDAFQGFFFASPTRVGRERIPCEGLGALRTMADLNATEDFDQLHRIMTRDAGLGIRLLRYANSAFVALPRRVGSIQEAMLWLGAETVRNFALMVAFAGARDVPSELLVTALVRARMCELMSGVCDVGPPDWSFTVGLFSVADALANAPMWTVVEELPFRQDIAAALVRKEGKLGEMLDGVIAYERGDFGAAAAFARDRCDVEQVYREAVKWADLSFDGLV